MLLLKRRWLALNSRFDFKKKTMYQAGLTMIELLVVIAILAVLIMILILTLRGQIGRSRDAQRKADLEKLKVSFEEYYNDNGCYPPNEILDNCGGAELAPYLAKIPCDPITDQPYYYRPYGTGGCSGYRVFAALEDPNDPIIDKLGCSGPGGCGFGAELNYGISVGVPLIEEGGSGGLQPQTYACAPNDVPGGRGECNRYDDPIEAGCPLSFAETDCAGQCLNQPGNWCDR